MKSIKETLVLPSAAMRMALDALVRHSKRTDFAINMHTFGDVAPNGLCMGCMATCAIQEVADFCFHAGDEIHYESQRANLTGLDEDEMGAFETAIDAYRQGDARYLYHFFGAGLAIADELRDAGVEMDTDNWQEHLPAFYAFADRVAAAGY